MKTPKPKSSNTTSVRSRAARREASPSVDVDKVPRLERAAVSTSSVLGAQHSSAVSKRKKKPQTRAQRLRQEKGLERAEIVMDKSEKKVAKSLNKGKVVKARKATWDDLNKRGTNPYKALQDHSADAMDTDEKQKQTKPNKAPAVAPSALSEPVQSEKFEFELDGEIT